MWNQFVAKDLEVLAQRGKTPKEVATYRRFMGALAKVRKQYREEARAYSLEQSVGSSGQFMPPADPLGAGDWAELALSDIHLSYDLPQ